MSVNLNSEYLKKVLLDQYHLQSFLIPVLDLRKSISIGFVELSRRNQEVKRSIPRSRQSAVRKMWRKGLDPTNQYWRDGFLVHRTWLLFQRSLIQRKCTNVASEIRRRRSRGNLQLQEEEAPVSTKPKLPGFPGAAGQRTHPQSHTSHSRVPGRSGRPRLWI